MSSHDPGKPVTSTAIIDPELSRHWPKRLARLMGVPSETARFWIYKRMPAARRGEIAAVLIAECDRLQRVIDETRKRWGEVADEARGAADVVSDGLVRGETGRVGARRNADRARPNTD